MGWFVYILIERVLTGRTSRQAAAHHQQDSRQDHEHACCSHSPSMGHGGPGVENTLRRRRAIRRVRNSWHDLPRLRKKSLVWHCFIEPLKDLRLSAFARRCYASLVVRPLCRLDHRHPVFQLTNPPGIAGMIGEDLRAMGTPLWQPLASLSLPPGRGRSLQGHQNRPSTPASDSCAVIGEGQQRVAGRLRAGDSLAGMVCQRMGDRAQ